MNGESLRDAGLPQAGSGVAVASFALWHYKALQAIAHLSLADASFSSEDIRRAIGEPPTPNSMGSIFREAYKRGWIVPDGVTIASRPSRHASLLRTWRRA